MTTIRLGFARVRFPAPPPIQGPSLARNTRPVMVAAEGSHIGIDAWGVATGNAAPPFAAYERSLVHNGKKNSCQNIPNRSGAFKWRSRDFRYLASISAMECEG